MAEKHEKIIKNIFSLLKFHSIVDIHTLGEGSSSIRDVDKSKRNIGSIKEAGLVEGVSDTHMTGRGRYLLTILQSLQRGSVTFEVLDFA